MTNGGAEDGDGAAMISPSEVRYIKLGDGGRWAADSIGRGYVAFGYHSIPHEVCVAEDWEEFRRLLGDRKSKGPPQPTHARLQLPYDSLAVRLRMA